MYAKKLLYFGDLTEIEPSIGGMAIEDGQKIADAFNNITYPELQIQCVNSCTTWEFVNHYEASKHFEMIEEKDRKRCGTDDYLWD